MILAEKKESKNEETNKQTNKQTDMLFIQSDTDIQHNSSQFI